MEDYRYIAHRGLFHNERRIPENSMLAFERAIKAGLPIELDVRMTRDKKLVVMHDAGCKRMTGEDFKVSAMLWRELERLPLLGTDQRIPLLSEVLRLVDGRVPLLIEVKNVSWIGYLECKLRHMLLEYHGKYMIESFHPGVVGWMKLHMKDAAVGQLVSMNSTSLNPIEKIVMQQQGFYRFTKPDFLSYDMHELTPELSRQMHKMGIKVYAWTVRSVADYNRVKNICDGVIFDTVEPKEIIEI